MQFIDLNAQQLRIKEKIERQIKGVLTHGKYIMGPEISELEEKLKSNNKNASSSQEELNHDIATVLESFPPDSDV